METRIVTALRFESKLRGGSQAHLLQTDDGNCYAVKFKNNPQHRRILVNELLSSVLLRYLGINTPATALVRITSEFLETHPEVHLTTGSRRVAVEPGLHFGSRYPGVPQRVPIYDFLPDPFLRTVVNLDDFLGALVFDKWVGNNDGRQSIFYRAAVRRAGEESAKPGFVASMIDHGFAFGGADWKFADSPLSGLYARRLVYSGVCSMDAFSPWLDRVENISEQVLSDALQAVPEEWIEGEKDALCELVDTLFERRYRLRTLLSQCRQAAPASFPNWFDRTIRPVAFRLQGHSPCPATV
jgi:hypothetical protein